MKIIDTSKLKLFGFYELITDAYEPIPLIKLTYACFLSTCAAYRLIRELAYRNAPYLNICGGFESVYNLSHFNSDSVGSILQNGMGFLIKKSRRSKKFRIILSNVLRRYQDRNYNCMCGERTLRDFAELIGIKYGG